MKVQGGTHRYQQLFVHSQYSSMNHLVLYKCWSSPSDAISSKGTFTPEIVAQSISNPKYKGMQQFPSPWRDEGRMNCNSFLKIDWMPKLYMCFLHRKNNKHKVAHVYFTQKTMLVSSLLSQGSSVMRSHSHYQKERICTQKSRCRQSTIITWKIYFMRFKG